MDQPPVAVIVPGYHAEATLRKCLGRVKDQIRLIRWRWTAGRT